MIDASTRDFLMEFFRKTANRERVTIICLALLRSHVHLLLRTGPRVDVSRLVQLLKGGSSYAASRQPENVLGLRWNPKYSVTSVSPRLVRAAMQYIQAQHQRHPDEAIDVPLQGGNRTG